MDKRTKTGAKITVFPGIKNPGRKKRQDFLDIHSREKNYSPGKKHGIKKETDG